MYNCPICNELGITAWDKLRSGTWVPATCNKCQGKSHCLPFMRGLFGGFLFFALFYSAYLALNNHSWVPIILFFLIWIGGEMAILKWVPMVPKKAKI